VSPLSSRGAGLWPTPCAAAHRPGARRARPAAGRPLVHILPDAHVLASPIRGPSRRPLRPPATLATLAVVSVLAGCAGDPPPAENALRVAVIAPADARGDGVVRGAELAAGEAEQAAGLIGRGFELRVHRAAGARGVERAARRALAGEAFALVGGFTAAECRALAELAERRNAVYFNVGCREAELRDARRYPNAFHLEGSEGMYLAARAEIQRLRGQDAAPVLWHPALARFGAGQLNDRFERRHGREMGGTDWLGWAAVKVLWEASTRMESTGARLIAAYLADGATRFDVHKGDGITFGFRDHQLRQPLYPPPAGPAPPGGRRTAGEHAPTGEAGAAAIAAAIAAGTPLVLVSNEHSQEVTAIDATTHRAIGAIAVASRPRGIQVAPDGATLYVALSDDAPLEESDDDGIVVIDLRHGRVVGRHPAGSDPEAFAVSPDGRRLYASNEDAGTATVTDVATGEVLEIHVVGVEPEGVAASPDGRWVYVTAETSNTVSVIDTRAGRVAATFLVDVRPRAAAFSPDGRRAYVSNEISGTLSIVDVARHAVIRPLPLDGGRARPVGVAVSPDGARVYVANGHSHNISVIDAATEREVGTVTVGRRPWGIAVSPDGRWIYTANGASNDVSVVDARTLQVVATVPVGQAPWGVAVTP
jgi:PQQ-dependent catabolism-associated beta-propeller protein